MDKGRFEVNENGQIEHGAMIKRAAENPRVARVFVNPAVKQKLCEVISPTGDLVNSHLTNSHLANNDWLTKLRPW
ncbi:MAG: penicillin-insensitive murein endopeptidase [Shewanella sp.]